MIVDINRTTKRLCGAR